MGTSLLSVMMCACVPVFVTSISPVRAARHASVDGAPVSDLGARFRTVSPAFYIGLTEGNLIGAPAGSYVAAADGFYPVLPPLVPGEHTLDFGGTKGKFSVDVRYDALTNNE